MWQISDLIARGRCTCVTLIWRSALVCPGRRYGAGRTTRDCPVPFAWGRAALGGDRQRSRLGSGRGRCCMKRDEKWPAQGGNALTESASIEVTPFTHCSIRIDWKRCRGFKSGGWSEWDWPVTDRAAEQCGHRTLCGINARWGGCGDGPGVAKRRRLHIRFGGKAGTLCQRGRGKQTAFASKEVLRSGGLGHD